MPLDLAVRMIVLPVQGGADIPEWIMFEFQGEIDRQKEAVSEEIHKLGTVKSSSLVSLASQYLSGKWFFMRLLTMLEITREVLRTQCLSR